MASIGKVLLALGLDNKELNGSLTKAENQLANSINNMKTILIGAQLGRYLLAGANDAINAQVDQMYAKLNLLNNGLTELQYDQITAMAEKFESLGSNAELAQLKITEFVLQGRGTGLKELGVYLDQDTLSMLKNASAAERLQFVLSEFPKHLQGMSEMLPDSVEDMLAMRKTMDDLKEAMGMTFLSVVKKLVDAFGGIPNVLKTAIIAFTAYKTAMILGNVGIGISKAIAQGGVFAAPVAIGMGAAALASIAALIGGASLAVSALNNIPSTNTQQTQDNTATVTDNLNNAANVNVTITNDRYGQMEQVKEKSNGIITNTQSKFGV